MKSYCRYSACGVIEALLIDTWELSEYSTISDSRQCLPRPRLVLLRGGRVRSKNTADGGANFYKASQLNTSSHGLHLRFRKLVGVRTSAAAFGPIRLVALSLGKLVLSTAVVRLLKVVRTGVGKDYRFLNLPLTRTPNTSQTDAQGVVTGNSDFKLGCSPVQSAHEMSANEAFFYSLLR